MNNLAYSRYKNDLRETFQKAAEHLRFLRISHLAQEHVPEDCPGKAEREGRRVRFPVQPVHFQSAGDICKFK